MERLKSRVFWVLVVGAVFNMAALLGYDMPMEKVAVIDAFLTLGMLTLAIRDMVMR